MVVVCSPFRVLIHFAQWGGTNCAQATKSMVIKAKTMLFYVGQSTINETYITKELQSAESRAFQGKLENGDHN